MTQKQRKNSPKLRVGIYLLIAIAVVWFAWGFFFPQGGQGPGRKRSGKPTVSVITIMPTEITDLLELPGRISPYRQAQIRPQVNGIITKRFFEEGGQVKKGDQLYQIDDARYRADMSKALADLRSAKAKVQPIEAKLRRYAGLIKVNAVSQQDYDDAKASFAQASAAVAVAQALADVAKVQLDYSKVYAPISGRIGKSQITEGALVTANQQEALAVITQLDPVYVDMQQSSKRTISLRKRLGQQLPVRVRVDQVDTQLYPYEGKLKFSEVTISESTSSVTLRALLPNSEAVFLPGLFVRAVIDLGKRSVLIVPQRAAVRSASGSLVVWVVDGDGKASPRNFTATKTYEDGWIVNDGLTAGETIVIAGYHRLKPDISVTSEPWSPVGKEK